MRRHDVECDVRVALHSLGDLPEMLLTNVLPQEEVCAVLRRLLMGIRWVIAFLPAKGQKAFWTYLLLQNEKLYRGLQI